MPAYNKTTITIIDSLDFSQTPAGVPWCIDTMTLAHHMGVRNRTLMGVIVDRAALYQEFRIKKKSGGTRIIHAPSKRLKFVQTRLLKRFFTNIEYPKHITAYVPERTTRFSAEQHSGKKVLIVLDLKEFFPSTRRSWVRCMLQDEFGFCYEVASAISDLATVPIFTERGKRYVVPQGAPTSGAICNWVAHNRIDKRILELCLAWDMSYTRYADDLAFSSNTLYDRKKVSEFIHEVTHIIHAAGYRVNRRKLRVGRSNTQQRLLGMTINEKPNVMRLQYRALRARIHQCRYQGFDHVATQMGVASGALLRSQIEGMIAYYQMINPDKALNLRKQLDLCHGEILHTVHSDAVGSEPSEHPQ